MMQLGLFYQMQVPKPWTAESESDRYWQMMEQVSYAEELGFARVWLTEHQFRSEWSHSSAPDVTLAALSQRTTRMRLGIAVTVPPVQHPLHIAARIATLDILSKGRVDLGVGRSGYPYQMAAFGVELEDATGMVEESLEILPRAWTEAKVSYSGRHYQIPPREILPKPVQKPHPPIWLGCSREETFAKAGRQGLGCLAMAGGGPERLGRLIGVYHEAAKRAEPVSKVVCEQVSASTVAICAETRQQAFQRGAEIIDWYRQQQDLRDARVWSEQNPERVPADYRWHYDRSTDANSPKRDETSSLAQIESGRYCIGDPDDCIRFLERYEESGVDEIMPLFQVGPITHEEVMTTLRLFGEHVIPHFREKAKKTG